MQFAQQLFLPWWVSYAVVALAVAAYAASRVRTARRRMAADLESEPYRFIALRSLALLGLLLLAAWYLNRDRGVGAMFLLFVCLGIGMHLLLTRTRWGRSHPATAPPPAGRACAGRDGGRHPGG